MCVSLLFGQQNAEEKDGKEKKTKFLMVEKMHRETITFSSRTFHSSFFLRFLLAYEQIVFIMEELPEGEKNEKESSEGPGCWLSTRQQQPAEEA